MWNWAKGLLGSRFHQRVHAFVRVAHWWHFYLFTAFRTGGWFYVECIKPDGSLRWAAWAKNGVTNAGLDSMNNIYFRGVTPITTWYLGLVDNAGFSSFQPADTMGSHGTWAEAAYISNSVRPTWAPGASSGQTVVNSSPIAFNINANSKTVKGLFLTSDNTISGTAGLLWATAAFSGGTQACNSGDTLQATYSVSGASG
jgi:hypothetical protein